MIEESGGLRIERLYRTHIVIAEFKGQHAG